MEGIYLHYFNANVEGRLPHILDFAPIQGRLVSSSEVSGQIITVVSLGIPRHHYVWSTFKASEHSIDSSGKMVITGDGWQLSPPYEIPEKDVKTLVPGLLTDHLFTRLTNPRAARWLLHTANKRKPPGNPVELKTFLEHLLRNVGNEKIENQISKVLKKIERPASKSYQSIAIPEMHRALSIRQPNAEQIMRGTKKFEFRSFATDVRGLVYVYAPLQHDEEEFEYCGFKPDSVPYGVIVGTVEIVDCTGTEGNYQWHLKNPKRFTTPLKTQKQPQPSFWYAF